MSAYLDQPVRSVGDVLIEKGYKFEMIDSYDVQGYVVCIGDEAVVNDVFSTKEAAVNAALTHYGESKCAG
jgi:hypothetical protein